MIGTANGGRSGTGTEAVRSADGTGAKPLMRDIPYVSQPWSRYNSRYSASLTRLAIWI